jgi:hypothetical protein
VNAVADCRVETAAVAAENRDPRWLCHPSSLTDKGSNFGLPSHWQYLPGRVPGLAPSERDGGPTWPSRGRALEVSTLPGSVTTTWVVFRIWAYFRRLEV